MTINKKPTKKYLYLNIKLNIYKISTRTPLSVTTQTGSHSLPFNQIRPMAALVSAKYPKGFANYDEHTQSRVTRKTPKLEIKKKIRRHLKN